MAISPRITDGLRKECEALFQEGKTNGEVAKYITSKIGLGRTCAYDSAREIRGANSPYVRNKNYMFKKQGNKAVLTVKNWRIQSLESLLDECGVDTDVWTVDRYELNSWEIARKDTRVDLQWKEGAVSGTKVDTGEMNVQPLMQVKAYLKKKHPFDINQFIKEFKAKISSSQKTFSYQRPKKGKLMYMPSVPDLHAGKLCWSKETGYQDYDLNIACKTFENALSDLMGRVAHEDISEIVLPIGNDLFNSDGDNKTTAGTPQDEDGRWMKTFSRVWKMLVDHIEVMARTTKVNVIIVSGNHDYTRCLYLGETLKAYFHNHGNVLIDNSPTQRKYYRFGGNLFMWTHGSGEKVNDLPMILANERPLDWGQCKHKEIMLGHFHHETVKDVQGTKVRVLPSLCPPDFWHSSKGYVGSTLGAQGFLYDAEKGLTTLHNYIL